MPTARAPKAFMAAAGVDTGVGIGGTDDTPIEWSCYSAPFVEQRWKQQHGEHQDKRVWRSTTRSKTPSSLPATPLNGPPQAGICRPHPPLGLGAIGADALAAMRGAKRPRPTAVLWGNKSEGATDPNADQHSNPQKDPQRVHEMLMDRFSRQFPADNSGVADGNGYDDERVEYQNSPRHVGIVHNVAMGSYVERERGVGNGTWSGLEFGLAVESLARSTNVMDVASAGEGGDGGASQFTARFGVGSGGESTRENEYQRRWQQDEEGSNDDLHILYGSSS